MGAGRRPVRQHQPRVRPHAQPGRLLRGVCPVLRGERPGHLVDLVHGPGGTAVLQSARRGPLQRVRCPGGGDGGGLPRWPRPRTRLAGHVSGSPLPHHGRHLRSGLGAGLHPHGGHGHGSLHPPTHPGAGRGLLQHRPVLLRFQPALPAAGGDVRLAGGPPDPRGPQPQHRALRGPHPPAAAAAARSRGEGTHAPHDVVSQYISRNRANSVDARAKVKTVKLVPPLVTQADPQRGPPLAAALRRVASYLELPVLLERPYVTYALAVTLLNVGYFVPYFHLVAHSRQAGFSEYQAAFVMSAAGASDILGRVASGWFSDLGHFRPVHLLTLWTALAGAFIMLLPVSSLSGSYAALMATGLLYGFCSGALTSLVFAVVPMIVGVPRMMGALGLLQLIESGAGLLGTPLSGLLKDVTGDYLASFVVSGAFLILGSLTLTTLPRYFSRKEPPAPPHGLHHKDQGLHPEAERMHGSPSDADRRGVGEGSGNPKECVA
ncbi:uncharacterized protein slc16a13 isoform X1 [Gasterosteus aculeatus]